MRAYRRWGEQKRERGEAGGSGSVGNVSSGIPGYNRIRWGAAARCGMTRRYGRGDGGGGGAEGCHVVQGLGGARVALSLCKMYPGGCRADLGWVKEMTLKPSQPLSARPVVSDRSWERGGK